MAPRSFTLGGHQGSPENDPHIEARFATGETLSPETPGLSQFGNSDVRWLDNLLYLYTKPFDIVVITFVSGETVS